MADRRQNFTDFQDPFDLLTSLHNTRMRMVYQNEFARGNRSDMNMGYQGQPSSSVGRTSMAQDRINVDAPSRKFDRSVGTGSYKPSVPTYNINLDYAQRGDARVAPELKRLGSVAKPLLAIGAQAYRNIQDIRTTQREQAEAEALDEASDIAGAPVMQKIESLGQNVERTQRLTRGVGIREDFLQRRAAAKQASNAEAMARTQETLGPQASSVLRPRGPKTAWDMLAQPDSPNVTATMRSINQPPATLPPPTGMPGAPMTSAGSQAPLTPGQMGTNTATLLTASTKASRPGRKKLPPPPPPQPPTMAPPSASQLPPPPMGKATKGTKGAAKGSKTTKPPTSS